LFSIKKMDFNQEIEELLPVYFSEDCDQETRSKVDKWRIISPDNEKYFKDALKAWEALSLLREMEHYKVADALNKVNSRLSQSTSINWMNWLQRAAAVLILPLLLYSGYLTIRNLSDKNQFVNQTVWETIYSRQGMITQIDLNDGTRVWLNSGSTLKFPNYFNGDSREVELAGEAYFEVSKNEKQPFKVDANGLMVEVLGTEFNVVSYEDYEMSEVVLAAGEVKLSAGSGNTTKQLGKMIPGQRVVFNKNDQKVSAKMVEVDKYTSWRNGVLIFRDDPMDDVVKRLSRWFNIEIIVVDPKIKEYVYKATFRDETLDQVLNLLRISAPIDYRIEKSKPLPNGEFTKQKVFLMKKKI
jgi:transmembrane sensor